MRVQSSESPGIALERDVQAHIARRLRDVYDEIASETIPGCFFELLEKLNYEKG